MLILILPFAYKAVRSFIFQQVCWVLTSFFTHKTVEEPVKTSCERWYVYQSEQYINAYPDLRLTLHSPENITCYLKQLGQNPSIADWQFRQAVHAIQILFSLINVPWIHEVDWSFGLESSISLNADHPGNKGGGVFLHVKSI